MDLSEKEYLTFFISSHNLPEVQRICSSIAIINKGRLLKFGKIDDIRRSLNSVMRYSIRIRNDASSFVYDIKQFDFVKNASVMRDTIIVDVLNPDDNNPTLIGSLIHSGAKVIEVREEETTLEDLYIKTLEGSA